MFNGAYSSISLTSKGVALGTCGLTMSTQSNEHDLEDNGLFLDTFEDDGDVSGDQ